MSSDHAASCVADMWESSCLLLAVIPLLWFHPSTLLVQPFLQLLGCAASTCSNGEKSPWPRMMMCFSQDVFKVPPGVQG